MMTQHIKAGRCQKEKVHTSDILRSSAVTYLTIKDAINGITKRVTLRKKPRKINEIIIFYY